MPRQKYALSLKDAKAHRLDVPKDEASARLYLDALTRRFQTSPVQLDWSRTKRGHYTYNWARGGVIKLGPNCWTGLKQALVHEFAHHLHWEKRHEINHGRAFKRALMQVAKFAYASPGDYCWEHEYKTVAAYGARRLNGD